MSKNEIYWDGRGKKFYKYRGESFYTITPIPYYYQRRKVILKLFTQFIRKNKISSICDYGCGDGEYIKKLTSILKIDKWGGGWIYPMK